MSNEEYSLEDVVHAINGISEELLVIRHNEMKNLVEDLHSIQWQLTRIANSLEKIADK